MEETIGAGLTFEKVWAMFQETGRKMEETDRQMKETDRRMKETDRKLGEVGNKLGILVEHMVMPNIVEKFNALGYKFYRTSRDMVIKDFDDQRSAEIDFWLENGEFILAIEVKTQLRTEHVNDYKEKMEKLRAYLDKRGETRKLIGAVAGAIVDDNVKVYAVKNGFYVLEQTGDTIRIAVPDDFKPKLF